MRLNRLKLTNFRLHTDTLIEFESGLTGIIGPNGSGKTTILEAIAWALYGMPAVRGRRQDIRSLAAPGRAGVKVELDFELAGHRHRVVRSLSTAELYLDGSATPIANSTTAVTDLVRRRLGMTQQEFFNTYFTGQKELGVMSAMGPAERAQFLSRVLGYEKLRGAQVLVRERRNLLRGELAGVQTGMPESQLVARQLADTEARLAGAQVAAAQALDRLKKSHDVVLALEPRWKDAQREREAMQKVDSELRVLVSEETSHAREIERLEKEQQEIQAAREEIARISAELNVHADLAARLHEMERLFQEEGRRKELQRSRTAIEQELARLREREAALSGADDALREAEAAAEQLRRELDELGAREEAERTDWVRDRQEVMTKREALLQHYREVRAQRDRLADLGPDSPCPTCTRPLGEHFREVLDDLDGRLTAIEVDGKYYRNRVEQLEDLPPALRELGERLRALEQRLDAERRRVTEARLQAAERSQVQRDIEAAGQRASAIVSQLEAIPGGYHETRHAQLRQQHAQLAPMAERSVRLGALAERAPRVRTALERTRKEAERVRKRLAELRQARASSSFSEEAFVALETSYTAAAAERHAAELAALAAEKELEAARAARATAEAARKELERAQERLRELTMDRRIHEELDRAYTDIRADLNQHLRPEISDLASGFLADLTDGRYGELELDDDYNVLVKEDGIPKPVISGGEEDLANLVLRLAISQMIAERAGQAFSLLILDEVFGSLDESRRHNVVELLRRLHDRFEQVVLITHIESVREGLDRVLSVRYDPEAGVSRVERESGIIDPAEDAASDDYAVVAG
jgi:DNA repair protein SbcC/Rad50